MSRYSDISPRHIRRNLSMWYDALSGESRGSGRVFERSCFVAVCKVYIPLSTGLIYSSDSESISVLLTVRYLTYMAAHIAML